MPEKKIFISHSSNNESFALWVSRFLEYLGVDHDTIFYSSNFQQGVKEKISEEVCLALENTVLDIIILSEEYQGSKYCLNEAGIIWFKGKKSAKIVIALPPIFEDAPNKIQAGFINDDYRQHRLMDPQFLHSLTDRLNNELSKHSWFQRKVDESRYEELAKDLDKYKRSLPIISNLVVSYVPKDKQDITRKSIQNDWEKIQKIAYRNPDELQTKRYVFYKVYSRHIQLLASNNTPGQIIVKCTAKNIVVNLSDQEYVEEYSSRFLERDGGYGTFSESFRVNGEPFRNACIQNNCQKFIDNPYTTHQGPKVTVPAHDSVQIEFITQYEISPELFFQSKVLRIPCAHYIIKADIDSSLHKQLGHNYIFRSEFFPPTPDNLRNGTVPTSILPETLDKHHLHYDSSVGFPAGGGYAITISKTHDICPVQ